MRPLARFLLCCLLLSGCHSAEVQRAASPAVPTAAETSPDTPAPTPEPRQRIDRMRETAAVRFFTSVEQVAKVAAFPVREGLWGLSYLLFPVIGFGRCGPV